MYDDNLSTHRKTIKDYQMQDLHKSQHSGRRTKHVVSFSQFHYSAGHLRIVLKTRNPPYVYSLDFLVYLNPGVLFLGVTSSYHACK